MNIEFDNIKEDKLAVGSKLDWNIKFFWALLFLAICTLCMVLKFKHISEFICLLSIGLMTVAGKNIMIYHFKLLEQIKDKKETNEK